MTGSELLQKLGDVTKGIGNDNDKPRVSFVSGGVPLGTKLLVIITQFLLNWCTCVSNIHICPFTQYFTNVCSGCRLGRLKLVS